MNKKREELCAAALELAAARRKYADTTDYVAWLRRQPDDCGLSIGLYWDDACIARIKSAERRLERAAVAMEKGEADCG